MKKRIFLSLAAVVAIALGVVGFSAFEAHIINVTATIENALSVDTNPIDFGTVFPQEQLDANFTLAMSSSFGSEEDADGIEYVIKQKPKCGIPVAGTDPVEYSGYARATEDGEGNFVCPSVTIDNPDPEAENTIEVDTVMLPFLCPYLSKHDADPDDQNDYELNAFHGPIIVGGEEGWTNDDTTEWGVNGKLTKSEQDTSDDWTIDLKVPCFDGQCDQGWADYVTGINPLADPDAYIQPAINEHEMFGCDLWIEVTGINRLGDFDSSLTLENKDADYNWMIEQDEFKATLLYNESGPTFDFKLTGKAMQANTDYWLIYYADPWPGSNPGFAIKMFSTDLNGDFSIEDSVDLGMDLPAPADANYHTGAKLWLVPDSEYDETTNSMTSWDATHYLYEYNLITYDDTSI